MTAKGKLTMATSANLGTDLVALLKNEALVDFGPQVITLIQGLMAAKTNGLAVAAAWLKFQGDVQPQILKFEADVASSILSIIQAKVQAAITAAQAALTQPAG